MSKNPLSVTGCNRLKLGLHEGEDIGLFYTALRADHYGATFVNEDVAE